MPRPIAAIVATVLVIGFGMTSAVWSQMGSHTPAYECCNEEELIYNSGGVLLAGVLLTPRADGPFPGAVIIQGSGDSDRTNLWSRIIAEEFVTNGLAVLLTDKRGSGRSGGDWRLSSFQDLADDSLAGVTTLKAHPAVGNSPVGLIGLSQGGRIAPLAASTGDVAFVVSLSSGSEVADVTLFHELEQTYRQYGLGAEDIAFLQELTALSFTYLETGEGWAAYLAKRAEIEARFGGTAVASWPTQPDDDYWVFWGHIHDFDPMPYWMETIAERGIPGFVVMGQLDEFDNVPVARSVERFETLLGDELLSVNVYPETGHSLFDEVRRSEGELQLVDGLRSDLRDWIDEHVHH